VRSAYRILAILVAAGVVLQAATIAFAWFDVLGDLDSGAVYDENSEGNIGHILHGILGMMVIPLLSLVLLIVSFFARIPDGVKWAGIVFGVAVLQVALAFVSFGVPAVGALHGMNALLLAFVASKAAMLARATTPAGPAATRTGSAV